MARHTDLEKAITHMKEYYMERISFDDLELATGVSRFSLSRSFRQRFGVSPMRWLWSYRIKMAAALLVSRSGWSCSEVAYQCGFETPGHFNRKFRVAYGRPPGSFRREFQSSS